jgi:uncharacterized protein (TIGR00725 family)
MYDYHIGVIGGSITDKAHCEIAYDVGKYLASRNCAVFCGGEGGIMECVSNGVHDAHGMIIGILPERNRKSGNKYLSLAIPTGIGYLRNFLIIRACDALIAIDGYTGTTSEAAFALTEGKSVISMGRLDIRRKEKDGKLLFEENPEKAVELAINEAKKYILSIS